MSIVIPGQNPGDGSINNPYHLIEYFYTEGIKLLRVFIIVFGYDGRIRFIKSQSIDADRTWIKKMHRYRILYLNALKLNLYLINDTEYIFIIDDKTYIKMPSSWCPTMRRQDKNNLIIC